MRYVNGGRINMGSKCVGLDVFDKFGRSEMNGQSCI